MIGVYIVVTTQHFTKQHIRTELGRVNQICFYNKIQVITLSTLCVAGSVNENDVLIVCAQHRVRYEHGSTTWVVLPWYEGRQHQNSMTHIYCGWCTMNTIIHLYIHILHPPCNDRLYLWHLKWWKELWTFFLIITENSMIELKHAANQPNSRKVPVVSVCLFIYFCGGGGVFFNQSHI